MPETVDSSRNEAETVTQLDLLGQVEYIDRRLAGAPVSWLRADYTYYDNGLVHTVTYNNGASIEYTYDDAGRVFWIDHRDMNDDRMLSRVRRRSSSIQKDYRSLRLPFRLIMRSLLRLRGRPPRRWPFWRVRSVRRTVALGLGTTRIQGLSAHALANFQGLGPEDRGGTGIQRTSRCLR